MNNQSSGLTAADDPELQISVLCFRAAWLTLLTLCAASK